MAASAPRFTKPPAIRQSPDDPTRLYLECQVQGTPKPDVTWFQNDNLLPATSTKQKQSVKTAAGNNYDIALEISDLGANDAGTYKIVVKNKAGEVTASVTLNFSNEDDANSSAAGSRYGRNSSCMKSKKDFGLLLFFQYGRRYCTDIYSETYY